MYTIICILPESQFTGQVVEVESENDYSFERVISIYGHPAIEVYPKRAWKRAESITIIEIPPENEETS